MNEPKNKISLLSPTIRNTKKKFILNSVNFNAANKPGQIRRSIKKRNTVAYTEPVFDERTKNKLKEKIDKKEGKGIMKYNNGDIYDGKWINDKFVNGKIIYNNGNEYEGNCDDKKKKGHGIMKYKNEELYEWTAWSYRRYS